MGASVQPETLDQKIARLEAARSQPSVAPKKETLAEKIARLEGQTAPVAEATGTRSPAELVAQGFSNFTQPYRRMFAPPPDLPPETTGERVAGALSAGYQGMTLGAGNKITAGVRTVLPEAMGGVKGFDFPTALKEQTQILDEYKARHPLESTALEIAGALPTARPIEGLLGIKSLGEGATLIARAKKLAEVGAKFGGVAGALGSNSLQDVPLNTAFGAAGGSVLGPVVGLPVSKAIQWGGGLLGRLTPFVGDRVRVGTGNLPATDAAKANSLLGETLKAGGVSPATAEVASPQQTVLDLGSVPTMRAVRGAMNNPLSSAGQDVTGFLRNRAQEAGSRIRNVLSDVTGYAPESFNQTVDQLNADMSKRAAPLYQTAMAHEGIAPTAKAVEDGPSLGELFSRPSMQKAVGYHNQLAQENGGSPIKAPGLPEPVASGQFSPEQWANLVKLNPSLATKDNGPVSMETLHNIKLRLDEMLGFARANGQLPDGTPATKKMLNAVNQTRLDLLNIIDKHNHDYLKARKTYAGDAAMRDAYENGRSFFAKTGATAADGKAELADLSPAEQEMWRRGGMTWMHDNLSKLAANPDLPHAGRNVNIIQRLFGSEHAGDRAKLLFNDPASYDKFVKAAGPEGNFPAVKNFFTGQSSTASQMSEAQAPWMNKWMLYHAAKTLAGGPASGYHAIGVASHLADQLGSPGLSLGVADELGKRATMTGHALRGLLDEIAAMPNPALHRAAMNRALTGASGAGVGLLREFSGQP